MQLAEEADGKALESGLSIPGEIKPRKDRKRAPAQRLAATELARLSGTKDYNLEEFRKNMLEAIDQGTTRRKK